MCAPRWDSPSIFSTLIGGLGTYAVTPTSRFVWGGYYEPGSLIWRSRWVTDDGIVESREALAFPGDPSRAVLLRRIVATEGDAKVRIHLEARADYGHDPFSRLDLQNGVWAARSGTSHLRWQGADEARPSAGRNRRHLSMELAIAAGQHHDLVLEIASRESSEELVDPGEAWATTADTWKTSVPELSDCLSPPEARHSYAVLRGLTASSGGMVAAATTSLPERSEAGRNYDYRYVWIRDQCYAGHAMAAVGDTRLLGDAVRFVTDRLLEHGNRLAPVYTVTGERVPDQRSLSLLGYPGGFDRIGNWVNGQFQLDAFGEALLLLADGSRSDLLDGDGLQAGHLAASAIGERWEEPDAGILGD